MLRVAALLLVASVAAAQQPAARLAAYRARIIGVYDLNTGAPIEGAEVLDVASGTKALTTPTGTVSLAYLPDGGSTVRIRKLGYTPITQFIAISPADTVPLTLLLAPTATMLPAVVTKDSARHYVSPGLREFEERRRADSAISSPRTSFARATIARCPTWSANYPGSLLPAARELLEGASLDQRDPGVAVST